MSNPYSGNLTSALTPPPIEEPTASHVGYSNYAVPPVQGIQPAMPGIAPAAQQVVQAIQAAAMPQAPKPIVSEKDLSAAAPDAPPNAKTWTFTLHMKDQRGHLIDDVFTHEVPTVGQKMHIARFKAGLVGGYPLSAYSDRELDLFEHMAHLHVCLSKRPAWANDIFALYDETVINALWEKASSHMAAYFRPVGST